MKEQMTSRERIMAVINHQSVDRIPLDYWGTSEMNMKLMRFFGVSEEKMLWDKLGIDKIINVAPEYIGPEIDKADDPAWGYWGIKSKPVVYGSGEDVGKYYEFSLHPLQIFDSVEEIIKNYVWPQPDWFDFSNIAEKCKKYPNNAIECGYMAPFYTSFALRGLENYMIDLAADEEIAFYILDNVCKFLYDYHERLFDAGKGKINITQLTDDFGSQTSLMISLEMFDKYFKGYYQRFAKLAKDYGIKIFHHDDGAIMSLIPRLVDLGIDILNPIQWHLDGMNLKELKERFGKSLCFHGGIDNQDVLPFGGVEDVRKEVIACMETLAKDNTGYILAPCHNLQVITPVENVLAMYGAALEYNKGGV